MGAMGSVRQSTVALAVVAALLAAPGCERPPHYSDADVAAGAHFYRAVDTSNAATRLINRFTTTGEPPTDDDIVAIVIHVRLARDAARAVPTSLLVRMHPDLPGVFRDDFEAGLADVEEALLTRDPDLMAEGYGRVERWLDWLEANGREIHFPPKSQEP